MSWVSADALSVVDESTCTDCWPDDAVSVVDAVASKAVFSGGA